MSFSRTQATWFLTKAAFLVTLSVTSAVAVAQTGDEPARGNIPPGSSQDGSHPAHGAIRGGPSIAPGETAGMPGRKPGDSPAEAAEMRRRCDQLTGPLRDECLDKPNGAATGGSAPRDPNEILKKPY